MTIDELKVVITAQNQDFNRKIDAVNQRMNGMIQQSGKVDKSMKQLSGTFSKMAKIAAAAFSIRAIYNFGKQTSEIARSAEANLQRVNDIFGSSSNAIKSFADQNRASLGMSRADVYKFSATYGNLFSTFMSSQQENAAMTQQYLNATAVVASKTGRTVEDVAERMRSGLLGNTEAIEDLGINVNIKTIEITDAFKRIADGRSWEQLNAYEQAQVRQLAILEQATKKYGTTVANNSSFAFQQASAAIKDFQTIVGNLINQFIVPLVNMFTGFMTQVNALLEAIFGKQIAQQNQSATATENNAAAMEDLADQTEQAGKAAKGALAPFDELNVISAASSASSQSSGTGTPTGITLPGTGSKTEEKTSGLVDRIQKKLDSLGFNKLSDKFKKFLKKTQKQIQGYNFGGAFSSAFESAIGFAVSTLNLGQGIIFPILVSLNIPGIVYEALNTLKSLFDNLKIAVDAVTPGIEKFVELGLAPIAGWVGEKIQDGLKFLSDEFQKFGNWVTEHQETFTRLGESIGELTGKIWKFIEPIADTAWSAFKEILAGINDLTRKLWDAIMAILQPIINVCNAVWDWADSMGILDGIMATVKDTINGIKQVINGIITVAKGVIDFIVGVFTGNWEKAWEGVKQIFKGIWDTFLGIVKAPLNGIIKLINMVIGGINKLQFDIPDWIPFIGGKHIGLNIPEIPLLASGGIVSAPTLAMVGEYSGAATNPEIVAPQSIMQETFLDAVWPLVDAVLEGTDNVVRAINEKDASVYLDSTELSSRLYGPLNRERTRRGNAVIAY